ncbi:glutaredoxin family protein [Acaricomes phytoseiuli]|uniref:glutaredoxin family protein n=1 Tax=Acaricomes phytoseiuli TaxID=291968 RepID=UPI000372A563|nr:glutaredoxin family protein [Acaricomes phytoseiuli]MCW1250049.1 glutaredoxin family protein [Acaricomes phytoseiuli]
MTEPALTLIVAADCSLCVAARETAVAVAAEFGEHVIERSLDAEPELRARFAEEVPVLLIDGTPRDFWRLDPVRLRRLLTERAALKAR